MFWGILANALVEEIKVVEGKERVCGGAVCVQTTAAAFVLHVTHVSVIIRLKPTLWGSITGQGAELMVTAQVVWYWLSRELDPCGCWSVWSCMGPEE